MSLRIQGSNGARSRCGRGAYRVVDNHVKHSLFCVTRQNAEIVGVPVSPFCSSQRDANYTIKFVQHRRILHQRPHEKIRIITAVIKIQSSGRNSDTRYSSSKNVRGVFHTRSPESGASSSRTTGNSYFLTSDRVRSKDASSTSFDGNSFVTMGGKGPPTSPLPPLLLPPFHLAHPSVNDCWLCPSSA